MKFAAVSTLSVAALASTASALTSITTKGNAFFKGNDRFFIRGVDYQPGGSSSSTDPLSDKTTCQRDVEKFKDLGINTIRVYAVDNSKDHDDCMKLLSDAGIYLILDLNTPHSSIARTNTACSYNSAYLQNIFATVDEFANYDNVLGFFAGNEVINSNNNTETAKYVKATIRDLKSYIKARKYRAIPVGYSAADVSENRLQAAQYFNCGGSGARADFFGINDYSWCGKSSFTQSGYSEKVDMYKNVTIPMFLSEFGCNEVSGSRPFTEIEAIYSDKMTSVFSGGLVYEYTQEDNKYGLVKVVSDSEVTELDDYKNLKAEYSKTKNPTDNNFKSSDSTSECPAVKSGTWDSDDKLPNMPEDAKQYLKKGAGKAGGFSYDTITLCKNSKDKSSGFTDSSKNNDDSSSSSSSSSSSDSDSSSGSSSSSSSGSSGSGSGSSSSSSGSSSSSSGASPLSSSVDKLALVAVAYAALAGTLGFASVF